MKPAALLLALYASLSGMDTEAKPTNQIKAGVGYAGAAYADGLVHGFKVQAKVLDRINPKDLFHSSTEFSIRDLIKQPQPYSNESTKHFVEFGLTRGIGIYSSDMNRSLEVLLGVLRMGLSSDGVVFWTPYVGIGADIKPFQLQIGAASHLRNNQQGVSLSLNVGYNW